MSRKRKKRQTERILPFSGSPQSSSFSKPVLEKPMLTSYAYEHIFSLLGYILTAILCSFVVYYFIQGSTLRPQIIVENLVRNFIDAQQGESSQYLLINSENITLDRKIETEKGREDAIEINILPRKIAGLMVPMSELPALHRCKQFGILISDYHKGAPKLYYGFSKESHTVEEMMDLQCARRFFFSSPDQLSSYLNLPTYYDKDIFPVPWEEADYFYMIFFSDEPTVLYITHIVLLGKS